MFFGVGGGEGLGPRALGSWLRDDGSHRNAVNLLLLASDLEMGVVDVGDARSSPPTVDSRARLRGLVPASRPARRVRLPGAECMADETHGSAWGEGSRPGGSHKLLSCLRLSFLINFAWQMSLSFPEPSQVRGISLSAVGLTDPVTSGWRQTQDIGGENVGAHPLCPEDPSLGPLLMAACGPLAGRPKKMEEEVWVGCPGAVTD